MILSAPPHRTHIEGTTVSSRGVHNLEIKVSLLQGVSQERSGREIFGNSHKEGEAERVIVGARGTRTCVDGRKREDRVRLQCMRKRVDYKVLVCTSFLSSSRVEATV